MKEHATFAEQEELRLSLLETTGTIEPFHDPVNLELLARLRLVDYSRYVAIKRNAYKVAAISRHPTRRVYGSTSWVTGMYSRSFLSMREGLENFFDGLCFDCSELSVALVVGRSFDSTDAITLRCFDEILKLLVFFFE